MKTILGIILIIVPMLAFFYWFFRELDLDLKDLLEILGIVLFTMIGALSLAIGIDLLV